MRSGTSSDFYEPPTAQEIMEHGRYLGLDPGMPLLTVPSSKRAANRVLYVFAVPGRRFEVYDVREGTRVGLQCCGRCDRNLTDF
jgi:hypothetical protein